jgi:hypothetical protein
MKPMKADEPQSVGLDVHALRDRARPASRLWVVFVAAFAVQLAAWTAWFIVAAHHRVAEVPLATAPAR